MIKASDSDNPIVGHRASDLLIVVLQIRYFVRLKGGLYDGNETITPSLQTKRWKKFIKWALMDEN